MSSESLHERIKNHFNQQDIEFSELNLFNEVVNAVKGKNIVVKRYFSDRNYLYLKHLVASFYKKDFNYNHLNLDFVKSLSAILDENLDISGTAEISTSRDVPTGSSKPESPKKEHSTSPVPHHPKASHSNERLIVSKTEVVDTSHDIPAGSSKPKGPKKKQAESPKAQAKVYNSLIGAIHEIFGRDAKTIRDNWPEQHLKSLPTFAVADMLAREPHKALVDSPKLFRIVYDILKPVLPDAAYPEVVRKKYPELNLTN